MSKCVYCKKKLISPTGLICPDCAVKNEDNYPIEQVSNLAPDSEFIKADDGKLQWSLMPFNELEDVVRVLMNGAKTYKPDNWKKCDDTKRYEDALMRHIVEYQKGNKLDNGPKGDGLPHLAHAICNCLFLMWFDNQTAEQNKEDIELKEEFLKLRR